MTKAHYAIVSALTRLGALVQKVLVVTRDEGPRATLRYAAGRMLRRENRSEPLWAVRPIGHNGPHGTGYQVSDRASFLDAVAGLPKDWTFVDVGCGKGDLLRLAREAGFQHCAGVEFVPEWAEKARLGGAQITIADAAEYTFPHGPLVVYLYNPFDASVLRHVVQNLKEYRAPAYIVYMNPKHPDCFAGMEEVGSPVANVRIWRK